MRRGPATPAGVRAIHIPKVPTPSGNTRAILASVGIGLFAGGLLYAQHLSQSKAQDKEQARTRASIAKKSFGRPSLGGPFELVLATTDPATGKPIGRKITHQDLLGRFSLVYFGFTNCPDICPEELEKMSAVVTAVENRLGQVVEPVFISCDPLRDTIDRTAAYAKDYHPKLLTLTGHWDDIKSVCKAYRVYFTTPPNADPNSDYLVDHSIFFYLMDPEGRFVEVFGRNSEVAETRDKVLQYVKQWKDAGLPLDISNTKSRLIEDRGRNVTSLDKPFRPIV